MSDVSQPIATKDVSVPIATINPATGETVKTFTPATAAEVDAAIARAHERFLDYRHSTTFAQRAEWAQRHRRPAGEGGRRGRGHDDPRDGQDPGVGQGRSAQVRQGFSLLRRERRDAARRRAGRSSKVGAKKAYTRYQPLGVVLAVMPWNFPLWQAVRFAAPALMAGNVGLLKHASNVPQSALYLSDVIARGGFPEGCFQTLLVSSSAVEAHPARSPGRSGHPDRQRAGRPVGRRHLRRRDQTHRDGARRQRPVHRDAVGGPRRGRQDRGHRAGCRTTGSPVSPPSGSSCTPTSTTRSSTSSSSGCRR